MLNYLRHGKLVIDKNVIEEGVLEEAEFYNITDLIKLLKERIHNRDNSFGKSNGKHVYRLESPKVDFFYFTQSSISECCNAMKTN